MCSILTQGATAFGKADSIMGEPDYEGINNKEAMEVVGLLENSRVAF